MATLILNYYFPRRKHESSFRALQRRTTKVVLIHIMGATEEDLDLRSKRVELIGRTEVDQFLDLFKLRPILKNGGGYCLCLANPLIELHDEKGVFAEFSVQHGPSVAIRSIEPNSDIQLTKRSQIELATTLTKMGFSGHSEDQDPKAL